MWKRWRWYAAGAVLGIVVLVMWSRSMGSGVVFADLIQQFPQATQIRPNTDAFFLTDVAIGGRTRKSIAVNQASRIVWTERLPKNAWLEVSLGLREEAWTRPGDGVLFMVGIGREGQYDELVSLIVNPYANPADRQWYPLLLDLSPYAGQEVEVIFNTRAGIGSATPDNDLAVWGAPTIVTR